jgi:hypothetical protein
MLSGNQCRERARHALETGSKMAEARMVAEYDEIAREWVALGHVADVQDQLQRGLSDPERR